MKSAIVFLFALLAYVAISQTEANLCNCRLPVFPKIVNGRKSNFSIPWLVQIRAGDNYGKMENICTGIIVKENWIATAASCIHNRNVAGLYVVAGVYNVTEAKTQELARVNFFKEHPDFDPYNLENGSDIALLQLQAPLVLKKREVELACLDLNFKNTTQNQPLLFTGLGVWNETMQNQTDVPRYAYFEESNSTHADSIIAVKSLNKVQGQICDGDIGGPLHAIRNGLNRVVGLASYNVGSANDANNDVIYCTSEAHFTKLSSAKAFIQKTIGYGHC